MPSNNKSSITEYLSDLICSLLNGTLDGQEGTIDPEGYTANDFYVLESTDNSDTTRPLGQEDILDISILINRVFTDPVSNTQVSTPQESSIKNEIVVLGNAIALRHIKTAEEQKRHPSYKMLSAVYTSQIILNLLGCVRSYIICNNGGKAPQIGQNPYTEHIVKDPKQPSLFGYTFSGDGDWTGWTMSFAGDPDQPISLAFSKNEQGLWSCDKSKKNLAAIDSINSIEPDIFSESKDGVDTYKQTLESINLFINELNESNVKRKNSLKKTIKSAIKNTIVKRNKSWKKTIKSAIKNTMFKGLQGKQRSGNGYSSLFKLKFHSGTPTKDSSATFPNNAMRG